jgi:hypothetical protein
MTSLRPTGENESGIHASHQPEYAEDYRKHPKVESESIDGELHAVSVTCSVLCIITGSPSSMVARDGWRSEDVEIVGLVASNAAESYSLREAAERSMIDLDGLDVEDFANLDDFDTPPVRRLAQAWNLPVFPEDNITAIAAEFGSRIDYMRDYFLPDLRNSEPQSIAGDRELLRSIAIDLPALASHDLDLARRCAWMVVNEGGWEIPNELAKRLPRLCEVDEHLAHEVSGWLLDTEVIGEWGWPQGYAMPFLIDHDVVRARQVAKVLSHPSTSILMYGMVAAIPSLWQRDHRETERFGRIVAASKDEVIQRAMRWMLPELRMVAPELAEELAHLMPSKSHIHIDSPSKRIETDNALERCTNRVLGVQFHSPAPSL